ncbi:hypothetical protein CW354_02210 [Marinicaulis flavus]|uniref:Uncharacterized protein n=1 Tax=Hyphococcus luteus TaxID=2058213 RepID=A0A2S7KB05_9PROT|nr:hypothetical protein CW354_02210 [Marinicaulis flavus]
MILGPSKNRSTNRSTLRIMLVVKGDEKRRRSLQNSLFILNFLRSLVQGYAQQLIIGAYRQFTF